MKKYMLHNKLLLSAVIMCRIVQIAIFMYFSILVRDIINMAISAPSLEEIAKHSLFASGYCIAQAVAQQLASRLTVHYRNRSIYLLRNDFFESILTRTYSEVTKKPSSYYISNLTNDINLIATDYVAAFFSAIDCVIAIVIVLIYGIYLSVEITAIMVVMAVFLVVLPLIFTRSIDRKTYKLSESYNRYMSDVKDVLGGYSSVKVYHAEQVMKKRVDDSCLGIYGASNRKDSIIVTLSTLTSLVGNGVKLLLVIVAATYVSKGDFDVGTITAILTLSGSFYSPVMDLSGLIGSIIGTKAVRMKLARLLSQKQGNDGHITMVDGDIRLEHIDFTYDNQRPILMDLSYTFRKNRKYLIIGASGCGKSTLLRLVAMLNNRQSGNIFFGEVNYDQIDFSTLIRQVTYVQQKEYLFDATLRQNIDLNGTGNEERLMSCVKMCRLEELISKLPNGLDTPVNEELDKISEGEKLRIVLARALYKGGSVFLLDEVTASLDNVNSHEIESMISKMDATVLSICHHIDSELMQRYDEILIMEDGKIIRSGSYEQLKDTEEIQKYLLKKEEKQEE